MKANFRRTQQLEAEMNGDDFEDSGDNNKENIEESNTQDVTINRDEILKEIDRSIRDKETKEAKDQEKGVKAYFVENEFLDDGKGNSHDNGNGSKVVGHGEAGEEDGDVFEKFDKDYQENYYQPDELMKDDDKKKEDTNYYYVDKDDMYLNNKNDSLMRSTVQDIAHANNTQNLTDFMKYLGDKNKDYDCDDENDISEDENNQGGTSGNKRALVVDKKEMVLDQIEAEKVQEQEDGEQCEFENQEAYEVDENYKQDYENIDKESEGPKYTINGENTEEPEQVVKNSLEDKIKEIIEKEEVLDDQDEQDEQDYQEQKHLTRCQINNQSKEPIGEEEEEYDEATTSQDQQEPQQTQEQESDKTPQHTESQNDAELFNQYEKSSSEEDRYNQEDDEDYDEDNCSYENDEVQENDPFGDDPNTMNVSAHQPFNFKDRNCTEEEMYKTEKSGKTVLDIGEEKAPVDVF